MTNKPPHITFFGTPPLAVTVLDNLKDAGIRPHRIVTAPDRPRGRNLVVTPPPVKVWADEHNIEVLQPESLKKDEVFLRAMEDTPSDLYLVAAYGLLIPQRLLAIPAHGTLNVHPSLLPRYRGPSPIQYQILGGEELVGVSIMLIDEAMDHGPILAQEAIPMPEPLPTALELEGMLAQLGGRLLTEIIPQWLAKKIEPQEQDHERATFSAMIKKSDGLLDLSDDALTNLRKIQAYTPWPGTYFFTERHGKTIRVKVVSAHIEEQTLVIDRVIPEGKKEMNYQDFLRG